MAPKSVAVSSGASITNSSVPKLIHCAVVLPIRRRNPRRSNFLDRTTIVQPPSMSNVKPGRIEEQWIRDGRANPLPVAISDEFDAYLKLLPWIGSSLDWSKMPPSRIFDLVGKKRYDLRSWIAATRIGHHAHIVIWYSRVRGGVIVPLNFAVANFDALYRYAPGIRFAFGVDVFEGKIHPSFGDLLQYGDGDELVAVS